MPSLVNRYFNKSPTNEQNLVQRLITESIQIQGITCYYLPRQLQNLDLVLGEDYTSKFTLNMPIEMYIETYAGWEGQSEMLSAMGMSIANKITFSVAFDRWNTEVKKIKSAMWVWSRPQEGDLIYDTITKRLFEIKFVRQDDQWYQLGKMAYFYKMDCEMFQFSNESISSGVADLDNAITAVTSNKLDLQILLEDGGLLLQENQYSLFMDVVNTNKYDATLEFNTKAEQVQWSAKNPFADL